ncbi:MAG: aminopeptidase P N-terminal domain-containing protein [Bdellovibrionales bacterium]|nr:aminopeptidase P N-terminal domain-containing protein [Bdellovibrionales bacterium]
MITPIDYSDRHKRLDALLSGGTLVQFSKLASDLTQDSFFHYLTGYPHADSVFVYCSHRDQGQKSFLFVPRATSHSRRFDGYAHTCESTKASYSIDVVHYRDQFWELFPSLLNGSSGLSYGLGQDIGTDIKIIESLTKQRLLARKTGSNCNLPIFDSKAISGRLRLIKEQAEIDRLGEAARITTESFQRVFQSLKPGESERAVHGKFLYEFAARGADGEAFSSSIATGSHATCLHYHDHRSTLAPNDLILIDTGACFEHYTCDMTRCLPLGDVSTAKRTIHELCCKAFDAALAYAQVGYSFADLNHAAGTVLVEGLHELGILKGIKGAIFPERILSTLYQKTMCHWVGLDVHDIGLTMLDGHPITFQPGMCIALEPGIYIDHNHQSVREEYRGIGVRIEDTILITAEGPIVLTADFPRDLNSLIQLQREG